MGGEGLVNGEVPPRPTVSSLSIRALVQTLLLGRFLKGEVHHAKGFLLIL